MESVVPKIPKYLLDELDVIAKTVKFIEYTVHIDSGTKHGDGFMATMIRITLKGKCWHNGIQIDYELPLICKLMPESVTRQESFCSASLFDREVYFYKTILPIFIDFLKEKKIDVEEEFSIFPKCFSGLADPVSNQYVIVMENLQVLGYELWNKTVPIDFETVAVILSELGKFHAVTLAVHDQRKDIFNEKLIIREPFFDRSRSSGLAETMITAAIQETIDVLDNDEEIKVMMTVKENYEMWLKAYLAEGAAGRFCVINHGDLWNNNIMFRSEPTSQQRKLRLVDFQLLRLTSPAIDLSYYLFTSTNPNILQRYEELLHIYYDSLATFLSKLGSNPQDLFTFSELEDQLRQFGKHGLIFSPGLVGVMVSDASDIVDMDTIKTDSDDNRLANLNEKTKILYKERMSSVIQLAIKYGWV